MDVLPSASEEAALEDAACKELDGLSFREILDQDSRPTFVLDLDPDLILDPIYNGRNVIRPIFCNTALRLHSKLLDSIVDIPPGHIDSELGTATTTTTGTTTTQTTYDEFRNWVSGVSRFNDSRDIFPLTFFYQGLLWTGSTVRQRWRLISGNALWNATDIPKGSLLSVSSQVLKADTHHSSRLVAEKALALASATATATATATAAAAAVATPPNPILPAVQPEKPPSAAPSKNTSKGTSGSSSTAVTLASPESVVPDWTVPNPRGYISEHIAFARQIDWASTPLGALESWSAQFRELVNVVMRNPFPCALFWGEELTMIYNEAYATEVAGHKHPGLMGTGFVGPFAETWEGLAPIFRECARTGQSIRRDNDLLPIERRGYLEETFFSWSFIPIFGGTDRILGCMSNFFARFQNQSWREDWLSRTAAFSYGEILANVYNAPFEVTSQTVSSRRLQMLRYLGECLIATKTVKQFWRQVLESLEHNHFDVPFALLYSIIDSDDADTASHSSDSTMSSKSCHLEGSIGIPRGHPASPQRLDLKRSQEGFVPAFRAAMRTREPTTLQTKDGTLPESLLEGINWRGYGDPCKEAIVFPLRPTNGDNVFAILLIGINPRRAYDDDYKAFAAMLNRQLATSLASVLLFEDEVRRSRHAVEMAQLQREQLTKQLEVQTSRMRRMTEHSPLGMYLFNPEGVLIEANERYYEMTGAERNSDDELGFMNLFPEESQREAMDMWNEMMTTLKPSTRQLQLKNPAVQPRDMSGEPIECWVMAYSQPDLGPNGELVSVTGSIADISHTRFSQSLQERRLREAEETKRQQNEFIDMTSHEMRNPLSAILICADDIRDSLTQHKFCGADQQVVTDCIEAANSIALCVQHQKSIVDDILTVSKLDSKLLLITPIPTQPVVVVQRAMSMLKPEAQAKKIEFTFCPCESLQRLDIDWVLLDPSRLLQITVNLITNAIKFTQASLRRSIWVSISASREKPDLSIRGFKFVPTRSTLMDTITTGEDWGEGERLYLRVEVEDTGCGLSVEEKELLFERFSQASPRTHAHYGGSGLGLFISRQLAELHGGQIGVSSEAGRGSTFGFFLQCKRMLPTSIQPAPLQITPPQPHGHTARPPPHHHHHHHHHQPTPPHGEPNSHLQPPPQDKLHILIVEDNLVNQKVLSKQLTKAGFVVATADNGLFALEHIENSSLHRPDGAPLSLVLMDLEMPKMDGLTCCRHIRQMQQRGSLRAHLPVIAVTANVRSEQIAAARLSGMDDVVSKPFRIPDLLAKIKALLDSFEVT